MNPGFKTYTRRACLLVLVGLAALSLTAAQTFKIKSSANKGGEIQPRGTVTVAAGGSQAYTITPNTGYSTTKVLVNKVDQGPITDYLFQNVQSNGKIKAFFQIQSFTVTFSATDGVKIIPAASKIYHYGAKVAVKVKPPNGSTATPVLTVDGVPVTLAHAGKTYKYTLTVTGPHVLQASLLVPLTLTVTKTGTGDGTVTSLPAGVSCGGTCSASFSPGSQVTLSANAAVGSTFAGWSGGGCSGTDMCQVTLNTDTTVTATFNLTSVVQHTLTVEKAGTGMGSVTSSPAGIDCGGTCSHQFDEGSVIVLSAAASAVEGTGGGSTFTGWSGGGCSGTGTCQVTLNSDTTVTATFTETSVVQHTLTVEKAGTGTGSVSSSPAGIDCGGTCSHQFDEGSVIVLSAAASAVEGTGGSSTFAGWSGGGCSGTGTCQVTLNSDTTVTATFNASGGGNNLVVSVTNQCDDAAVGAIVAVHRANGTVQQTFTVGASGTVDVSSFGKTVTFTVGWPNSMNIPSAEIHSFVSVPSDIGTFRVSLEGGACQPTDPTLATITVDIIPVETPFATVDPLGVWLPNANSFVVHRSQVQNDGSLTLLANDFAGAGIPNYGFLIDQTLTNGGNYVVNLNRTPSSSAITSADNLGSVFISGQRKGLSFNLGQTQIDPPATSGEVSFFDQFPASTFQISASAPFLTDPVFGFPYSSSNWTRILSSAPGSVSVPSLLHITDLTYDSNAVMASFALSDSSAGTLVSIGFANTLETLGDIDDRFWSIVLDPTQHSSWAESNLTLPSELDITGRTPHAPILLAYQFSYIHTYADVLTGFYTGGVTPPSPPYDFTSTLRSIPPEAALRDFAKGTLRGRIESNSTRGHARGMPLTRSIPGGVGAPRPGAATGVVDSAK